MQNSAYDIIKASLIPERVSSVNEKLFNKELHYLECRQKDAEALLKSYKHARATNQKTSNPNNSLVIYALGLTDSLPLGPITKTPTTLPDIDHDSSNPKVVLRLTQGKYGENCVAKLGTNLTIKTKGAIKDVGRHIEKGADLNAITKLFDSIDETKYKDDLEFFHQGLATVDTLRDWFAARPKMKAGVEMLLGNVKATGVHASGLFVTNQPIYEIVPCSYDRNEGFWVTMPDMKDTEAAGLVKYDFLGLNTLADLNRCVVSVKNRHDKNFSLNRIDVTQQHIFDQFTKGNTKTVFQFNTPLATGILKKIKRVSSILDLALITSVARPGPLNMKMDEVFIRRINGEEKVTYEHPMLEQVLSETYGIIIFQEQVMQIVQSMGGLSGDESLTVMKAMGKKQLEKLAKFRERFLTNAETVHGVSHNTALSIWNQMESFAEYGFNKSHAICYALLSYWCMYCKINFELDWIMACFQGGDKEDYRVMFEEWKDKIIPPNISYSRNHYYINEDRQMVVTPFSSINDVGDKAMEAIAAAQPFFSFDEFFTKVEKRTVNKKVVLALILSGTMDTFKTDPTQSLSKFRKELAKKYFELKHAYKKPSKLERKKDEDSLQEVESLTRAGLLKKEVSLTNAVGFDYHSFFPDIMGKKAIQLFGSKALTPGEAKKLRDKAPVVIGGAKEKVQSVTVKKETSSIFGKTFMILTICSGGESIDVTVWPDTLEADKRNGGKLANMDDFTPLLIKGKISIRDGKVGISLSEAVIIT